MSIELVSMHTANWNLGLFCPECLALASNAAFLGCSAAPIRDGLAEDVAHAGNYEVKALAGALSPSTARRKHWLEAHEALHDPHRGNALRGNAVGRMARECGARVNCRPAKGWQPELLTESAR